MTSPGARIHLFSAFDIWIPVLGLEWSDILSQLLDLFCINV